MFFKNLIVLFVVNFFISPLSSAISLTNFEEIIWFSTSDIRKIVSTESFNFLFIPANWNSYSKSETALNPLNIILRGLRAVSDFEYEFQLAGMNRKLNKNIETIFVMSDVENQIISSKFVKEIAELKGDIKKFTTKSTIKALKNKLIWRYS